MSEESGLESSACLAKLRGQAIRTWRTCKQENGKRSPVDNHEIHNSGGVVTGDVVKRTFTCTLNGFSTLNECCES